MSSSLLNDYLTLSQNLSGQNDVVVKLFTLLGLILKDLSCGYEKEIGEIKTKNDQAEVNYYSLLLQLNDLKRKVTNLSSTPSNTTTINDSHFNQLEKKTNSLEQEMKLLSKSIESHQFKIQFEPLQQSVTQINSLVDSHSTQLNDIQTVVKELTTKSIDNASLNDIKKIHESLELTNSNINKIQNALSNCVCIEEINKEKNNVQEIKQHIKDLILKNETTTSEQIDMLKENLKLIQNTQLTLQEQIQTIQTSEHSSIESSIKHHFKQKMAIFSMALNNVETQTSSTKKVLEQLQKKLTKLERQSLQDKNQIPLLWECSYKIWLDKYNLKQHYSLLREWTKLDKIEWIESIAIEKNKQIPPFIDFVINQPHIMLLFKTIDGFLFGCYNDLLISDVSKKKSDDVLAGVGFDEGHFIFSLVNPSNTPFHYHIQEVTDTLEFYHSTSTSVMKGGYCFYLRKTGEGVFSSKFNKYYRSSEKETAFTGNLKFRLEKIHIIRWI
ncbi:hypothetical protein QTN25_001454 [Entamoeba marina]